MADRRKKLAWRLFNTLLYQPGYTIIQVETRRASYYVGNHPGLGKKKHKNKKLPNNEAYVTLWVVYSSERIPHINY